MSHFGGNATFSYDAVGNRMTVSGAAGAGSYAANALNQYTSAGGVGTLTYDANGNLASGGGWTFTHNGDSRLTALSGPANATFGRDARNREVKRTINGTTTYLIYDGWNLVAEYDTSGALTVRYIHGPRIDEVLAKVNASGSTYPLEDAIGSTIAVTDDTGTVLERITYTDAFGTPEFRDASGSPLAGTTTGTRYLFTGREWHAQLGLYDYRNRTYSPALGRFIQTDPIGFSGGDINLYRYVTNAVTNLIDYLGLWPSDPSGFTCGPWTEVRRGPVENFNFRKENEDFWMSDWSSRKVGNGNIILYTFIVHSTWEDVWDHAQKILFKRACTRICPTPATIIQTHEEQYNWTSRKNRQKQERGSYTSYGGELMEDVKGQLPPRINPKL